MTSFYDIQIIEDYLADRLVSAERTAFELAMKEDEALREAVLLAKDFGQGMELAGDRSVMEAIEWAEIELEEEGFFEPFKNIKDNTLIKGIEVKGDSELKKKLHQTQESLAKEQYFEKEKQGSTPAKIFTLGRILTAAASIIGLLFLGQFLLKDKGTQLEATYAKHFEINQAQLQRDIIDLGDLGFADAEKMRKQSLQKTLMRFQQNKLNASKKSILQKHLKTYPNDETAIFYLALTEMETNDFINAKDKLLPISRNLNSTLQKEAAWYLALCYMKQEENKDLAIATLKTIAQDSDSPYIENAKQILQAINE